MPKSNRYKVPGSRRCRLDASSLASILALVSQHGNWHMTLNCVGPQTSTALLPQSHCYLQPAGTQLSHSMTHLCRLSTLECIWLSLNWLSRICATAHCALLRPYLDPTVTI